MLWFKALHIISLVAWFAGLFYLPRLFVYHSMANDEISQNRFQTMEKKLYRLIMWPAAVATLFFGSILLSYNLDYYMHAAWMHAKLSLVFCLLIYHLHCGRLIRNLEQAKKIKSTRFYRLFNEIPTVLLVLIVILVVVRPF